MKIFLIILLILCGENIISQTRGYVLMNADGSVRLPEGSISNAMLAIPPSSQTGLNDSSAVLRLLIGTKQNTITTGTTLQYFRGDFSLATFPTTTSFLTNSTNKNFVTDAQLVILGNTSGTNSGDNSVNTLYSGLAASKQNTLVSGTNIRTINGNTLLGSGDLVISAGATSSTSGVAATATASGTTTVTHNLGRTPTIIRIYSISSFTSNAAATPVPFSTGTWNSTGNRCLYMVINGTTTQVSQTSTVFSIIMVTSAGNNITGVIGNVTSTSFDISWSETGTHTAGNYLWEAQ